MLINVWMRSGSVPSAYRAGYIKQLIGHVALTSVNMRRHHVMRVGAYSLNNLRLE